MAGGSAFEEDAAGRGFGRRHAEVATRERLAFGGVDLELDTGFHLGQSLAGDTDSGEVIAEANAVLDAKLCDRILVLCGGKVSGIVEGRGAEKRAVGMMMTKLGGEDAK